MLVGITGSYFFLQLIWQIKPAIMDDLKTSCILPQKMRWNQLIIQLCFNTYLTIKRFVVQTNRKFDVEI
ncbi:hypothetical protein SH83_15025 [Lactiplantibacillus plantarum]|nr:hypothetical protein SH83_15025 [Lactiplantibacillus plantarum]ASX23001.1 hypothetical protein BGV74_14900 [Lactiplantibacillus plantarum]KKX46070.1 hypothetical protein WH27_09445 [Lactiplantibacillus plantarum]RCI89633.1 hypothetical protein DT256_10855 [Lactiplantibacillus plantarum]